MPNCGAWVVKMDKVDDLRLWVERMSRFDCCIRMLEVIVAAELYRRHAGRYPGALEDLVPEFLPSVPVDPFDRGAPVKYDAQRGVIWTVGPDRKCDGDDKLWRLKGCIFPITGKSPNEKLLPQRGAAGMPFPKRRHLLEFTHFLSAEVLRTPENKG